MGITDEAWGSHPLSREEITPWIEAAQRARVNADILDRLLPPLDGSSFGDEAFHNMAMWCSSLLDAALSHLTLWADYAVPLKFHPESQTAHRFRPAFTLARAALECSAQALWVLSGPEDVDVARRYFALGLWVLDEQTKAAETEEQRAPIRAQRDEILSAMGLTIKTFKQPRYLDLIRSVAHFIPTAAGELTPDRMERIWRMAAGAAHGKQWPDFEMASGDSPQPIIEAMSEILTVSSQLASAGVMLLALRCGRGDEWEDLYEEAFVRVATAITTVDGVPLRPEDVPDFRHGDAVETVVSSSRAVRVDDATTHD